MDPENLNAVSDERKSLRLLSDLVHQSYSDIIEEIKKMEEINVMKGTYFKKDIELISPE